jgi:hypothetical protein
VYSVNDAGLITKPLSVQQMQDTVLVKGVYGVFYQGTVKPTFKSATGTVVSEAASHAVTPLDSFALKDTLKVPAGATRLVLAAYTLDGALAGNLDSIAVTPTSVMRSGSRAAGLYGAMPMSLRRSGTQLGISVNGSGDYSIDICLVSGKRVASFTGIAPQAFLCRLDRQMSGIVFVKTRMDGRVWVQKIVAVGNNE